MSHIALYLPFGYRATLPAAASGRKPTYGYAAADGDAHRLAPPPRAAVRAPRSADRGVPPARSRQRSRAHGAPRPTSPPPSLPDRPGDDRGEADHVRHRHRRDRRPGLSDRPGRLRAVRPSGLLRELPGLHDRRHPGLGPVPRLRAAPRVRARAAARSPRSGSARAACCPGSRSPTGPTCAARSATSSPRRGPSTAPTSSGSCSASTPCPPAGWQQARHSNLLDAINSQPDETPGDVSYTTVRSLTDETVQPQGGKHPTSALDGARNILIQDVCPGRETTHIGTAVDSVTWEALVDAVAHKGKGEEGRREGRALPERCLLAPLRRRPRRAADQPVPERVGRPGRGRVGASPKVPAEPKVRRVFKDPGS